MKIIISSCQVLFNFYNIHDDDTRGDEVVEGATVYRRGCTRLPPVLVTREQRWTIRPQKEK